MNDDVTWAVGCRDCNTCVTYQDEARARAAYDVDVRIEAKYPELERHVIFLERCISHWELVEESI